MCNNDCNNCPRQICDCRPGILKENNKYRQALDEIEKLISEEVILWDEVDRMTTQILDIISKTKDNKNE